MKKIVIALLVAVLLTGLVPMAASLAEDTYASVYSGNEFGVRLREGPATTYASDLILPSGTTVTVLETGTIWTRIQVGTKTGYMMSKFLVSGGTSTGVKVLTTATVFADNGLRTWLRSAPNGKRLGLYSDGTPVNVLEKGDEWCRVMIGSSVGYMMTRFLTIAAPTPEPVVPFQALTAVTVNYPYPLQGDTLLPIATPVEATYTCKWFRVDENGSYDATKPLSTNNAYAVSANDVGYKIRLEITGNGKYAGAAPSYTTNPVTNSRKVTGVMIKNANTTHTSPVVGDALSATIAPSSATVTFSWRVAGVEKSTAASYTVAKEDVGKAIQVYVTATGSFSGSASSAATTVVVDANTITKVELSTKYPVVGQAVGAVITPANAKASYIWYVNGAPLSTAAAYTPSIFDLGDVISVKVTGVEGFSGIAASAESAAVCRTLLTGVTLNNTVPSVGATITATVQPDSAKNDGSVRYQWYHSDVEIVGQTGQTYTVVDNDVGQAIHVVATGEGVYGGSVASAKTATATANPVLASVSLDNTAPVVGDVITAVLNPDLDSTTLAKCTFIWQVGSSRLVGGKTYQVSASDVGQQIRVQVNPGGGEIKTSGATNAVIGSRGLDGISVYTTYTASTKTELSGAPQVGQTLTAAVNPRQAMENKLVTITYNWYWASPKTARGASQTYTVTDQDMGKQLYVEAKATGWYLGKEIYSGTKGYTTAGVPNTRALDIDLGKALTPETGKVPVYSTSGDVWDAVANKAVGYTATVASWSPALASNGTFKPEVYTATLNFSLPGEYRLGKVTAESGAVAASTPVGNTVTLTYPAPTSSQTVTRLSIAGLAVPVVGNAPDGSIDLNEQYEGAVTWSPLQPKFALGQAYTATIALTAKTGYTFASLPGDSFSVFTVPGARSTRFVKTSDTAATVTAAFPATGSAAAAQLTASRTSVPVGSSKKYVQCEAALLNFAGDQSGVEWKWELSGAYSVDTSVDSNGLVTIALDEIAERTLTVTATTTNLASGANKSAAVTIKTVAETAVTGDVTVDIIRAPSEVPAGGVASYAAEVKNSNNETVVWSVKGVDGDKKTGTKINGDGVLTVSADESVKQLAVTARSVTGVTSTAYVTVIYSDAPTRVAITTDQKSMSYGATGKFAVSISQPGSYATNSLVFNASDFVTVDPKSISPAAPYQEVYVRVNNDAALVGKEAWIEAVYTENMDDGTKRTYHDKWAFMIVGPAQYDLTVIPANGSMDTVGQVTQFGVKCTPEVNGLRVNWDWNYTGSELTFDKANGVLTVASLPAARNTTVRIIANCFDNNGNALGTASADFTIINPLATTALMTLAAPEDNAVSNDAPVMTITPDGDATIEGKAGATKRLTLGVSPKPEGAISYGWSCEPSTAGYVDDGAGDGTGVFTVGSSAPEAGTKVIVQANCWDENGNKLCEGQIELTVTAPTGDAAAPAAPDPVDPNANDGIALTNELGGAPVAKTLTLSASHTKALPGDMVLITPTYSESDELAWTCSDTTNAVFTAPVGGAPFAKLEIGPDAVPGTKYTVFAVSTTDNTIHDQCTIEVEAAAEPAAEPVTTDVKTEEPVTTNVNPEEPTTTNVNPEEPTTTNANPEEPVTTDVNPEEPTTTNANPEEPVTTNANSEEPTTTNANPEEPVTTNANPEEPTTTNANPEEPAETPENIVIVVEEEPKDVTSDTVENDTPKDAADQTGDKPADETKTEEPGGEKPEEVVETKTEEPAPKKDGEYQLSVTNGIGGGLYKAGVEAAISALDKSETHEVFTGWTGDVDVIPEAERGNPNVTILMPEKDLTLVASYAPTYLLTVVGGTPGSAWYQEGAVIELIPDAAPEGGVFSRWNVSGATLTDNTLTMGAAEASVEAVYAYSLKVVGGTADAAQLEPGKSATLTLDKSKIPEGQKFSKWTANLGTLEKTAKGTTITMPKTAPGAITVKAAYKDASAKDEPEEQTPAGNTGAEEQSATKPAEQPVNPIEEEETKDETVVPGDHNPII